MGVQKTKNRTKHVIIISSLNTTIVIQKNLLCTKVSCVKMVLLKDLASSLLLHVLFYLHIVTLGDFPIIVSTLMRKKT